MGTDVTQLDMRAGESLVYLHREGVAQPRPLAGEIHWSAREWGRLNVASTEVAETGDRLTFRQPGLPLIVKLQLPMNLSVRFSSLDTCPICRTADLHDAEIPDLHRWQFDYLGIPWNCYVLRTCLVCQSSWEQEAL